MKVTLKLAIILILIVSSCQSRIVNGQLKNVGMLLPDTVDDEVWNSKGYEGLLQIQSTYDVDVFYKESIDTESEIRQALEEFSEEDVNLVFGHGNIYAPFFLNMKKEFPEMDFVTFNGDSTDPLITNIQFEGKAMGFFAGMVAAEMSKTKQIGVIAAFPWQPEVEGFQQGAKNARPEVVVNVGFVHDWGDKETAEILFRDFIAKGVDVFFPAGDGFNIPLIQKVKREGLFAIGYVSDQLYLGKETILTSTVQHVDKIYVTIADQYNKGVLEKGTIRVDFADGAISLGEFSPVVPESLEKDVKADVQRYIETGKLPETP